MRHLRYNYFNVLDGRQFLLLLLVLFVLPVGALYGCGRLMAKKPPIVGENVFLNSQNLGGLTAEEAVVVIGEMALDVRSEPVDAAIDSINGGVIPEVNGVELDVEGTLAQVMQAQAGSRVEPALRDIPAEVSMSAFPYAPLYRGNPQKPQVTFLVNVAWGNEYLAEMLDVLQQEQAGATFFLVGRWVRGNPEAALQIREAGFELANHGDSDALSMAKASFPQALDDIRKANDTIENVCGVRPVYFSPHRGEITDIVLKAAAQENCRTVMWTVDTVDWKLPGVDTMVEKILAKADGGSLILMHPTEQTAEFLRRVIPALRARGLEPVCLSELLCPSGMKKDVKIP